MADTQEQANPPRTKTRSPNYPALSLKTALERAREFYKAEGRNAANVAVAIQHWNFKAKSSGGIVTLAALKSFGLLSDEGSGNKRSVRLTELALRILLDNRTDGTERSAAIKEAALKPKIHSELWTEYQTSLPSDETLRHNLIFDWKFNENTVGAFIREYKDTIKFAELGASDIISAEPEDTEEADMTNASSARTEQAPSQAELIPKPLAGSYLANSWTLSPQVSAELRIHGEVTPEDLELLRDYVEITIKALSRKAKVFGAVGHPKEP